MMDRLDLYLAQNLDDKAYCNTEREQERLVKFIAMYQQAKSAKDKNNICNDENVQRYREAYKGTLPALSEDGSLSSRKMKTARKMCFEFVESKIDNTIPLPRMTAKNAKDRTLVEVTENYLKYEIDNIFAKYINDQSERATYVDGTSWYKIWWDSTANGPTSSGNVRIDICLVDQIVPQPGIKDWRKLQYIFELQQLSTSTIYDLFHRVIVATGSNTSIPSEVGKADMSSVTVITCYYINDKGIVGRFMWAPNSMQVICDEEDWQIRKLRTCTVCGHTQPQGEDCEVCGSTSFKYHTADTEYLDEDLYYMENPYEEGQTNDLNKNVNTPVPFLTKGTEIPYYRIRMLPFVPRPAISDITSLYGMGEPFITLESQDSANKILTKAEDKTLKSGALITKPRKLKLDNDDKTFKIIDVDTAEQAQMFQTKQVLADTSQDIVTSNLLYDSAKVASGITDSFQGQRDTTATSGKAKEFAAMQTAGRIESLRVMKAAAFAGVYEIVLKYLLAFSDESRQFVKVLPNGQQTTQEWNKYMFLSKTKDGRIYYRDSFSFSTDPAATLATNRAAMWQETRDNFMNGLFGNPSDSRTLEMYWNLMEQQQYPLAKLVLAGIKDNSQHLPPDVEQMLIQNPEVIQAALQMLENKRAQQIEQQGLEQPVGQQGGSRINAGREGNGATHSANVERTNERNRAENRTVTGAVQGGTSGNISNAQAGV